MLHIITSALFSALIMYFIARIILLCFDIIVFVCFLSGSCEVKQYCEQSVNHCFHIIFSPLVPIPAISFSLTQAVMAVVAFSPTNINLSVV